MSQLYDMTRTSGHHRADSKIILTADMQQMMNINDTQRIGQSLGRDVFVPTTIEVVQPPTVV